MSRLDPPLRYYHSPPITHVLNDSPLTLDAAHTLIVDFLALAPTHPELHPHASFTHHGLKFPQSSGGGGGAAAMSDGNLAMLTFVERGMKGEDARKEVEERKRLQREEKEEVDVETAKPKAKKRKKEEGANDEEQQQQQWDWEDPSVLAEKSEAEDGGRSWAASASVTATNVKKVPEVKDTAEEDGNDEDKSDSGD